MGGIVARAYLRRYGGAKVSTVVTACPTCKRQLDRDDVHAVDLIELLDEATRK